MRVAVVFYSFSGNTRRAARILEKMLTEKGAFIESYELKPVREPSSFAKQCMQAVMKQTPDLVAFSFAAASYDALILATPVWAFTVSPAVRTFLKELRVEKTKAAGFVTYHSGAGVDKALADLGDLLTRSGARCMASAKLAGGKTGDEACVRDALRPLVEAIMEGKKKE